MDASPRAPVFLLAAAALCGCSAPEADTVLLHGTVLTVDSSDTIAQALAIRGGRIVAVGTDEQIERHAGDKTRVIDLKGLTVTPGLIDSHCHLALGGMGAARSVNVGFPEVRSVADVARRVKERVDTRRAGDWILGADWDEGKLAERRLLGAADLDPVSPHNPVWLEHLSGHYGVANSAALRLAGIGRDTPDPPGGTIDRDARRNATGVLKEEAMGLVSRLIPEPTPEERVEALARITAELAAEGMTAAKDPWIDPSWWEAYKKAHAGGRLKVRVATLWRAGRTAEEARDLVESIAAFTYPRVPPGEDRLVSLGIKMMLDGSGGARTAWLHEDWNKDFTGLDAGNRGYPIIDPEVYRQQFRIFHDAGMHVGTHAIGDRAIDWVTEAYEAALAQAPKMGLRHSIIHCNLPSSAALERIARMQKEHDAGYPEVSSTFLWWIGDTYAGNWGPQRSERLVPLRSFQERDIVWGGGSDYSVTPFPARYGWDRNPYAVSPDEIKEMRCLLTFLGGEIVHRAPEAPADARNLGNLLQAH
jgi:hypothetical protein